MKRRLSIAELIRQDVLDLDPEPPRRPCLIAPRLLILACSATKAEGEGLVARDRYQGPLWQTLRAVSQVIICKSYPWVFRAFIISLILVTPNHLPDSLW